MFIIGWISIETNLKWNELNSFEFNQIQFNWNFLENIIHLVESKGD